MRDDGSLNALAINFISGTALDIPKFLGQLCSIQMYLNESNYSVSSSSSSRQLDLQFSLVDNFTVHPDGFFIYESPTGSKLEFGTDDSLDHTGVT